MTAKESFQKSNTFRDAAAILASEHFQAAANTALLIMVENLPIVTDPVSGNNIHQQLCGARRIIGIMQGLIRTGEEPTVPRRDTLNPTK